MSTPEVKENTQVKEEVTGKGRKTRFNFNNEKDIFLLKGLINANPWHFGETAWDTIVDDFDKKGWYVSIRTLKSRMELLRTQLKSKITIKTGTEEERSERANLIEEMEGLIEAEKVDEVKLVKVIGAEDEGGDAKDMDKVEPKAAELKKTRIAEKRKAEDDRDKALNSPPDPSTTRAKRSRIQEESLIFRRAEHEMDMEARRMRLEEEKESRVREENARRDAQAQQQLDFQKSFLDLMTKLVKKD